MIVRLLAATLLATLPGCLFLPDNSRYESLPEPRADRVPTTFVVDRDYEPESGANLSYRFGRELAATGYMREVERSSGEAALHIRGHTTQRWHELALPWWCTIFTVGVIPNWDSIDTTMTVEIETATGQQLTWLFEGSVDRWIWLPLLPNLLFQGDVMVSGYYWNLPDAIVQRLLQEGLIDP